MMMFIACCNGVQARPRCLVEVNVALLALTHGRWMLAEGWLRFACAIGWDEAASSSSSRMSSLNSASSGWISAWCWIPVAHSVASILRLRSFDSDDSSSLPGLVGNPN